MVESRTPRPPVRGSGVAPEPLPIPFGEDVVGTEMAVLGARELMSRVVDRLNLIADPHFNATLDPGPIARAKQYLAGLVKRFLPPEHDTASATWRRQHSDTVDAVIKSIKLTPVPRSRVIQITTSTWNRDLAARISNLVSELYITGHLGLTQKLNVEAQKFLSKRLADLQAESTAAAERVEDYRVHHGLSAGASNTLLQERMTALDSQLLNARARAEALQAQYDAAKATDPRQLSMVINSPTLAKLREAEVAASSKRAEVLSRFGPNAPQLKAFDSVLTSVRGEIDAEANRQVKALGTDLTAANANVAMVSGRLSEVHGQLGKMEVARARLDTLQAESKAALNLYSAFLNRSKETDANLLFPTTDVRVVSLASPPARASFPRNLYTLPAAALISLLLAMGCGLLVEARRKGLTSAQEIEAIFEVPALGLIPLRTARPAGLYRDSIEHLLNRIYFGLGARTVLVTSALPQEGKTTTAQALANAAMSRGLNVLLVDADLRSVVGRPNDHVQRAGLSEVLRGEVDASEVLQVVPSSNLSVLPAGRTRENPTHLLSLPRAHEVLQNLSERFDLVIVDGPPVLVGGDCWMLAQHVGRTIMVVKWGSTPVSTISLALKQLGTQVAGVVLSMVNPGKSLKRGDPESALFSPLLKKYHGT